MTQNAPQQKIQFPLFKDFVPPAIRPWIYVFFAIVFQLSDCVYLGSLNAMVGNTPLIREDVMMCGFFALVGVNMPFPLLFRLKFRSNNKAMLTICTVTILVASFVTMITSFMPVLCLFCFMAGFCKLWGTFECMSNIQLWMTPKRDFSVFFPLLYCIVLGDIYLSEVLSNHMAYYYDWHYMQWLMIGLLLIILLILLTTTKVFHIMKMVPLYGVDWLGGVLWAAWILELIYICNYGEYFNWFVSPNIRIAACAAVVTGYFCINRMRHIHHPFISPDSWKYKNLWPMLLLFFLSEIFAATPNVLQNSMTEGLLHFDYLSVSNLSWWMIAGIFLGNAITFLWVNRMHLSYIRLLFIGFTALVVYQIYMYLIISSEANIELLYIPTVLRGMGYTIVFCSLTIYLEEMMPFQHFFHGLFIVGIIRTGLGAAIGSALYSFGMRYSIANNIAHYNGNVDSVLLSARHIPIAEAISRFMQQMQMISIKQLYGWTALVGTGFIILLLFYDTTPVRSTLKRMPYWKVFGRKIKKEVIVKR